ncbi:GntR family transcriptional regulator [Roseibium sediminicola]|uniref:GntR family transcriptional regulator n=1 Tax=Roseibium sediminicola TaxID=2933272 RepID=A0ABT0H511_9HYPH|nr:GntR family transcriptional regulator [Roseibium sp. CAU 1639]
MDSVPVYQLIQDHFEQQMQAGVLKPGMRLPAEKEIAKQFQTSRATVQSAMARLVHEGRIEKRVGSGTYVSDKAHTASMKVLGVTSFEEELSQHGEKVSYRLLSLNKQAASSELADSLNIEEGATIVTFERLRLVANSVIGLERRTFDENLVKSLTVDDLDRHSTHELVARLIPQEIGRMEASLRAVVAGPSMAEKLNIEVGAPLLRRNHRMFSKLDSPLMVGEAFYCEPFVLRYTAYSPDDL